MVADTHYRCGGHYRFDSLHHKYQGGKAQRRSYLAVDTPHSLHYRCRQGRLHTLEEFGQYCFD